MNILLLRRVFKTVFQSHETFIVGQRSQVKEWHDIATQTDIINELLRNIV
jgi:hypothetical protein